MNKFLIGLLAAASVISTGYASPLKRDFPDKLFPLGEEFLEEIKTYKEDTSELKKMPRMTWESKGRCEILCSDKEKVSFKITCWVYSGGAHGMTWTKVGTLRRGKLMTLADLPNLSAAWKKAVSRHPQASDIRAYLKDKSLSKAVLTENFYQDDKGIHFVYNPYEIACFAAGTIQITIPLAPNKQK